MSIDFKQLNELLTAISQTDITELTLKSDDFELTVRKGIMVAPAAIATGEATLPAPLTTLAPQATISQPVAPSSSSTTEATAPTEEVTTPSPKDKKWVEITSPMVGTFYRAPAPDEPAFVEVSDRISTGQTVCIIEAMKLMNEIEAEVSGQVVEIAVENGEPVEYGQTLMWVDPG